MAAWDPHNDENRSRANRSQAVQRVPGVMALCALGLVATFVLVIGAGPAGGPQTTRNDMSSKRSYPTNTGFDHAGATSAKLMSTGDRIWVTISFPSRSESAAAGIKEYRIYRGGAAGSVASASELTYLGRSSHRPRHWFFVDPSPVAGASYGVQPVGRDNRTQPMIFVQPNYDESAFLQRESVTLVFNGGKWVLRFAGKVADVCTLSCDLGRTPAEAAWDDDGDGPGTDVAVGLDMALLDSGFEMIETASKANNQITRYQRGDVGLSVLHSGGSGGDAGRIQINSHHVDENGRRNFEETEVFYKRNYRSGLPEMIATTTAVNAYQPRCGCYHRFTATVGPVPRDHWMP